MKICAMRDTRTMLMPDDVSDEQPVVIIAGSEEALYAMKITGMIYEGDLSLREISFCKMEAQPDCLSGTLCIPRHVDVINSRYRMLIFINRHHIVIIDDDNFASRMLLRMQMKPSPRAGSKEGFLFMLLTQLISRDVETLSLYDKRLRMLEEDVVDGKTESFESEVMPIRRELLVFRTYYDELMDMAKELEDNENDFFAEDQLKYFGTVADRADRLMSKTQQLLEYAQQVSDTYQARVDEERNKNMQLLTVISTVFYPLTLITGWFGMNFIDMPGLENGFPAVVIFSVIVVVCIILWFKKRKML